MIYLFTSLGYNEGLAKFEHVAYYWIGIPFLVAFLGGCAYLLYRAIKDNV
jgi:hypothetical protein